jgi:hypothetical protein
MAASRVRAGVVGDSSTTSRVFCRWSAKVACWSSIAASKACGSAFGAKRLACVRRIWAKLWMHSASSCARKRAFRMWVVATPHTRYRQAPSANQPPCSAIASSDGGAGAAIENSIEKITENVIGPPRLPQAINITARKVPATSTMPSSSSSSRISCTSMNSGVPNSGAGSICMILRRRGAGTSGRLVMSTPTAALEAPTSPADS